MGNTRAEIAIDLHEHEAKTNISVHGPVNIITRDFNGKPTQHKAIQLRKISHWLNDSIANLVQRLTIGDLSKYGLHNLKRLPMLNCLNLVKHQSQF